MAIFNVNGQVAGRTAPPPPPNKLAPRPLLNVNGQVRVADPAPLPFKPTVGASFLSKPPGMAPSARAQTPAVSPKVGPTPEELAIQAEADRKRREELARGGAFSSARWRYAGELSVPRVTRQGASGTTYQQALAIPAIAPSGTAAALLQSRRQLMIERRQGLGSLGIPGTGG